MEGPWRVLLAQGSAQIFHFFWPDSNENNYSSGTEDGIDPKPGSEFEFVHCIKVYKKKLPIPTLLYKGPPKFSPFYQPTKLKRNIPVEPKVGLNLNKAVNLSLSMV